MFLILNDSTLPLNSLPISPTNRLPIFKLFSHYPIIAQIIYLHFIYILLLHFYSYILHFHIHINFYLTFTIDIYI